jgi:hypothetical protein
LLCDRGGRWMTSQYWFHSSSWRAHPLWPQNCSDKWYITSNWHLCYHCRGTDAVVKSLDLHALCWVVRICWAESTRIFVRTDKKLIWDFTFKCMSEVDWITLALGIVDCMRHVSVF